MNLLRQIPLILLVMCSGCATTATHNLSSLTYDIEPSTKTFLDPTKDFSAYKTFSVISPVALIGENAQLSNEIEAKQVLFSLRNSIERMGYQYVGLDESPDLVFTIDGSSVYQESYVPPTNVVIPRWVPGQTYKTYGSHSGSANLSTYGSGGSTYGYGTYSGTSTATTTTSGYLTTDVVTLPGYTVGNHYPALSVFAFESATGENVWHGSGTAMSNTPDFRISSQILLIQLISQLPVSDAFSQDIYADKQGRVGVDVAIVTLDGNNYFPAVIGFAEDSPASKSGLKTYDIVTSINGESTRNLPLSDVARLATGDPGSTVSLLIWRMGSEYRVTTSLY